MPLGFKKNFRHQPVAKLFLANLVNCKHKCQRPFPYVLSNKTFRESVGYSLLCNMFVKQRVLYTEREIVVSNWCWNKVAATNIPRVILELMLCGNHLVSSFGVGHQQVTKICPTPRCSQPTGSTIHLHEEDHIHSCFLLFCLPHSRRWRRWIDWIPALRKGASELSRFCG